MDEQDNDQQDANQGSVSLDQLQTDLDNAMNGWKRAQADFENYKRRKEVENKELVEFAREVTVAKLLPALDSLEQALKHMPEYNLSPALPSEGEGGLQSAGSLSTSASEEERVRERLQDFAKQYQNWQTGVNGIVIQLDKTLGELGVKKIEAVGKKFDPHFHEAVREVESESEDGIVVEEFQTGFELNGKLIRPSQVVISKRKN